MIDAEKLKDDTLQKATEKEIEVSFENTCHP